MGRSYGDSALAARVISTRYLNHVLDFDAENGIVTCQSGVTVADLLEIFVPRGWVLPVVPGTRFVSVGGAIASDVHGKNHHVDGCFSNHLQDITIMLADGTVTRCSRLHQRELFHATCGGMGLTGLILTATFQLRPIQSSHMIETTFKAGNVSEALDLLQAHAEERYTVAWVDCASRTNCNGRSLVMVGSHAEEGGLGLCKMNAITVPTAVPGWLFQRQVLRAFNALYYHRNSRTKTVRRVHYDPFMFPLDRIGRWNRLYGKAGFLQYHLVVPEASGSRGIIAILQKIAHSQHEPSLAVLKIFGDCNDNYLSFPMKGYSLAVDFKRRPGLGGFLNELDHIVLEHGGRIYLAKDARMTEHVFKQGYPRWTEFARVRQRYGANKVFRSLQSERLGIG